MALMSAAALGQSSLSAPAGKPDLTSPKSALASAYAALKAGDVPAAKSCFVFKDATEADLFDVTYTQLYGPLKLMHAMEAKFGPSARKPFANAPLEKGIDDLLEKVKAAEIDIDASGAAAVVADKKAAINPNAESELTGIAFKRDAGGWKIVAATFFEATGGGGDMPPAQLRFMRTLRDHIAAACDATAARLAKGDFKTAEEAYADYQSRAQAGLQAAAIAATQK